MVPQGLSRLMTLTFTYPQSKPAPELQLQLRLPFMCLFLDTMVFFKSQLLLCVLILVNDTTVPQVRSLESTCHVTSALRILVNGEVLSIPSGKSFSLCSTPL